MVIGESNIMRNTILYGDCRDTLKQFDEQARTCITSPPYYGLRDYGGEENQIGQEKTPEAFIEQLVSVFKEVRIIIDLVKVNHILNNQYLKLIKTYQHNAINVAIN